MHEFGSSESVCARVLEGYASVTHITHTIINHSLCLSRNKVLFHGRKYIIIIYIICEYCVSSSIIICTIDLGIMMSYRQTDFSLYILFKQQYVVYESLNCILTVSILFYFEFPHSLLLCHVK